MTGMEKVTIVLCFFNFRDCSRGGCGVFLPRPLSSLCLPPTPARPLLPCFAVHHTRPHRRGHVSVQALVGTLLDSVPSCMTSPQQSLSPLHGRRFLPAPAPK